MVNLSRNIALNKTADSSSDYKSDTVVAKAVDGNTQSKWSSGRKDPGYDTQEEWMSVDLGQISYIDGVKIDWEVDVQRIIILKFLMIMKIGQLLKKD